MITEDDFKVWLENAVTKQFMVALQQYIETIDGRLCDLGLLVTSKDPIKDIAFLHGQKYAINYMLDIKYENIEEDEKND